MTGNYQLLMFHYTRCLIKTEPLFSINPILLCTGFFDDGTTQGGAGGGAKKVRSKFVTTYILFLLQTTDACMNDKKVVFFS